MPGSHHLARRAPLADDGSHVLGADTVKVQVHLARALSACFLRRGYGWRLPVVRVAAVWPGAVHRPGREDAPLVDLAAYRTGDRKAGEILLPRGVTHVLEHSPPRRSARTAARLGAPDGGLPGARLYLDVVPAAARSGGLGCRP